MSSLSRDDVAKLAGLARIEMSEEELVNLSNEFTVILDAVARVPSLTPEEALSGAPAQEEQRFRVPQILGEE
jgi:aspartyl-tRNA(Asn)/glutamyl-tRNA(Gln) amidotransferase subunit C